MTAESSPSSPVDAEVVHRTEDPSSTLVVGTLGRVKYLGSGWDEAGANTFNYCCMNCGAEWFLPDVLPLTRGHRCPSTTYVQGPNNSANNSEQSGEQRG